jgi:hypothetical protein
MAELRLDVLRVDPVGDQQAGVGMAEVVKPDAPELGPPERRRELPVPEVTQQVSSSIAAPHYDDLIS